MFRTFRKYRLSGLKNKASLIPTTTTSLPGWRSQSPPHGLPAPRLLPNSFSSLAHRALLAPTMRTWDNVWGHFRLSQGAEGCAAGIWWAAARDAAKYPRVHRTAQDPEGSSPNIVSAEAEKLALDPHHVTATLCSDLTQLTPHPGNSPSPPRTTRLSGGAA